jgi:glycosyltransferase involved in cell wall biosynthesis
MILLVSSVFPPEPVVSATIGYDLANALSESWEVTVLAPKPTRPLGFRFKELTENQNFRHIVLSSYTYPESRLFGRLRESYSFGKHVVDYLKKHHAKIECIYLHSWPLIAQYQIVKFARKYSIPVVSHIVDIYPEALSGKLPILKNLSQRVLLPLDKYALKNSAKVVTISPKMKDHLSISRGLEINKVDVVYNWQDEKRFLRNGAPKNEKEKSRSLTFMFLGSLSPTAAIHVLISAYKNSGIESSRLVIAGNGSQKDFLVSCAGNAKSANIEFWDAPMHKVPEIQEKADVLLLSLSKGASLFALPSKLPAYMFSGKPVIACVEEESDTAAVIKQANCGWVVAPEDINAISGAMKMAASLPKEELENYGRSGHNYALENFSKTCNLQKFVSIIESAIG